MQAGYAQVDYTPEPGLELQGQQFRRVSEYARDPLCACAVAFRQGDETIALVAVDSCAFPSDLVARAQQGFGERTGLPGRRLLVSGTHSHVAPHTFVDQWGIPDPAFLDKLVGAVVEAAAGALDRMEPASVFRAESKLEHLGWNRRTMFADGASQMHGDTSRPDFIGVEGPRDTTLSVLYTRDQSGAVTGVLTNFAIHPNCVECGCYYSADLPGEIRRLLKLWLGPEVGVLHLTGAAGNVTGVIRDHYVETQPWMGEEGLWRSGLYLAGEAAKLIAPPTEPSEPVLRIAQTALSIPIRPWPEKGSRNQPDYWSDESRVYYEKLHEDWPRRMREESPVEVRVNVVRIGDVVICTNPAEFFVEFGLTIRDASPAAVTIVSELMDGYVGYIPTRLAFERGGYETWPAGTSKLVPEAGEMIVDATRKLLQEVF